ncbi:hypothetical protein [Chitinophaga sancti]|uniref:Multiple sugar transport system permease protein n=1 Tax=Chitinophaga sancti TaxID=1004 RepID=A0ABZ0XMA9_9BACT|nr:hypothetical protein [Chitinophaga sancti]WQG91771.1 hypothetical protein SR876_09660 [Chitinophaga sancti]
MKTPVVTQNRILRDVLISIFIYALPVVLMLLSFKISGQRPWKHQTETTINK